MNPQVFSFIETRLFTRLVQEFLNDEQYTSLQLALIKNPDAGSVMAGAGGIRKLRWMAPGRGKRGGYRVIYYVRRTDGVIWLLTIYPKNVMDDIPATILKRIREEIDDAEDQKKYR
jgi:mRNA-degrading endonuclease RelE of RelBE toxin-antitoxin system